MQYNNSILFWEKDENAILLEKEKKIDIHLKLWSLNIFLKRRKELKLYIAVVIYCKDNLKSNTIVL